MAASRLRRVAVAVATYGAIILVTLVVVDLACIGLGIFPPRVEAGDPDLGWRPARATGRMEVGKCLEFSTNETVLYQRNEEGVRTSLSIADTATMAGGLRIAVVGDSHTDLCAPNEQVHSGVLESGLRAAGVEAVSLNYGTGRYSPLQEYLAFRLVLRKYRPRVLVMNLYTGNDFYDILRTDDRPHFARVDSAYVIAPPVWYTLDDPLTKRRSRVLALARAIGDRTGIRAIIQRLSYLRVIGSQYGGDLRGELAYLRSLTAAREASLGYPDALTAQMLNQQLFLHHFPTARAESLRRLKAVLALARDENPGMTLVLSPIPSYQLVGEKPVDSALVLTTSRLPLSIADGAQQEQELYDALRPMAEDARWLFVDNLTALREYRGPKRLFNNFDYHLLPSASTIVGSAEREALLRGLLSGGEGRP